MPELPEVETTRRGMAMIINGHRLNKLLVHHRGMRWPIPDNMEKLTQGHTVLDCQRRGKYILINFEHGTQIVHLGMSGSLRRVPMDEPRRKHDHVEWIFDESRFLLHDPRRFGAVLWHNNADGPLLENPLLKKLGIEPFDDEFDGAWLHKSFKNKKQNIKQALLGGQIVVGVGNIYASESLFLARINPTKPAKDLKPKQCNVLAQAIKQTLNNALESGGSTLRDYTNASGEPGAYFDLHARVYSKEGQPCHECKTEIKRIVQGQRATYYCPKCQI